ncbi:MAG TPA: hypothetical protein VKX28_16725 [Xanthobacteraceae bacterium]|jgi:hypothetical protein|nr:hypothetical protein [Xanthobacteraceae bacterium]
MADFSRRTFVGASVAGLCATAMPSALHAATACVTGPLPGFLPTWLSVDCASKHNFRTFRRYSDAVGLAGVVSMSFVRGSLGTYPAGSLFLFPWLKPKGQGMALPAVKPLNAMQYVNAAPIPDATLPLDEYFLRFVLQAPWTSFIGFLVDVPYNASDVPRDWCSNVDKLADGEGVGIDWTSHNLNGPWFGGSTWIPGTDACGGKAWRNLVVAALGQAAVGAC